ncbi:hypothetical protein PLESTM_000007500 [Pleodorina starrii]|nr:hypothetical protein PLESTM_000007500 [Pleodorina starrii]
MIKLSWEGILASVPGVASRHARCLQPPRNRLHLHSLTWTLRRESAALNERSSKQRVQALSTVLAPEDDDAVAFCLDSAIADLSYLTITVAYNAAHELWPDRVVGPVGLYVEKARSILPALAEPHHAVVLVRLLSDEGVIGASLGGARSTAGREGPVVGRAVRNTGSRPLLVAEIAEHWPVVMDSCLLRWSLEGRQARELGLNSGNGSGSSVGGNSRDELLARTREAFQAAQTALAQDAEAVEACLSRVTPYSTAVEALKGCSRGPLLLTSTLPIDLGLRVMGRCGLASTSAGTAEAETEAEAAAAAAAVALAERPVGLDLICAPSWGGAVARVLGRAAAGGNRVQLVTGNLARLERLMEGGGWEEEEEEERRSPREEADAEAGFPPSGRVGAAAAAGAETTAGRAALRRESGGDVPDRSEGCASASASACSGGRDAGAGPGANGCSYGQLGRQDAMIGSPGPGDAGALSEPPRPARSTSMTAAAAAREGGSGWGSGTAEAAAASSWAPSRAATIARSLEDTERSAGRGADAASGEGTRPPLPDAAAGAATDAARGIGGGGDGGGASASLHGALRVVHLAEWSCASMSFRARALSHQPRASLLSEHQLAEWLGVTHLDLVMDGVAWR